MVWPIHASRAYAPLLTGRVPSNAGTVWNDGVYNDFDIILDQISPIPQLHATCYAPCAMLCGVPTLIGC